MNIVVVMPQGQTDPLQVQDSHQGPWRCCWRQLLSYAMKTQLNAPKARLPGHVLPFTVSLWHKSTNNRFFLCIDHLSTNQSTVSLGISTNESGPLWAGQARPSATTGTIPSHDTALYSDSTLIRWPYVLCDMSLSGCVPYDIIFTFIFTISILCALWRCVLPLFYL